MAVWCLQDKPVLWVLATKKTVQTISVVRSVKRAITSWIHLSQVSSASKTLHNILLNNSWDQPPCHTSCFKKNNNKNSGMTWPGFFQENNKAWQAWRTTNRPQKNLDETTEIRGLCLAAEALSLSTLLISSTCADASLISLGWKMLSPWESLKNRQVNKPN